MTKHIDLLVIGGGINGTGVAADAAGRGLNVTLCEQNDLGSATSSASSKLIHGGLRYLENYEFNLVRKALLERDRLLKIAPHLIKPLKFVIPHHDDMRHALIVRLGLLIYGRLGGHSLLPRPKKIRLSTAEEGKPLSDKYIDGFSYYDCKVDDSRLVISNALAAKEYGAEILVQTKFIRAQRHSNQWDIELQTNSGEVLNYNARAIVNAAGPWVSGLQEHISNNNNKDKIQLVKGSHIVVPQLYSGDHAYLLQNSDKRIVFVIPYQGKYSLIGTTEVDFNGNPAEAKISEDEKTYLCDCVNKYFSQPLKTSEIIWSYSGVRPLIHEPEKTTSTVTRDYEIKLDNSGSAAALITIYGGKVTTYRVLSEQVINKLKPFFPKLGPNWTKHTKLPGGNLDAKQLEEFIKKLNETYPWLEPGQAERYANSYGNRCLIFLDGRKSLAELGENFGAGLYQREIEYLIEHEWATSCEDILWRRSKLGLHLSEERIDFLNEWLSE